MYIVYMHKFPNNKVYIGITGKSLNYRWGKDGSHYSGQVVFNAIKKYGWNNVEHIILATNLTKEEASNLEIEYIKKYKSNDIRFGYNITSGGEGGSLGVHRQLSEEHKRKIGEANKIALKGRVLSLEHKELLRQANLGRKKSDEEIEKIRQANLGKHHTDETKHKLSIIQKNRTQEEKEIIAEKRSISLKKTGKERAAKRAKTMKEKYPEGYKQTKESNLARSIAHKGKCKSEETKQKMRKPKSPEAIEHMKKAQQLRWVKEISHIQR